MISKTTNSVIDEIHQTRTEISVRFGGNIEAIAKDAARRQSASSRVMWKPVTQSSEAVLKQP